MRSRVVLILLAAGNGSRFGEDKLSYPIDGIPMLSRALRLYTAEPLQVCINRKILVIQPERDAYIEEARLLGYECVLNPSPDLGISESIRLGIQKAEEQSFDGCLFSVADQPYLSADTVLRILTNFDSDPTKITAPSFGRETGNPVLFPNRYLKELLLLKGDRGGKGIVRLHIDEVQRIACDERELTDVDSRPEV